MLMPRQLRWAGRRSRGVAVSNIAALTMAYNEAAFLPIWARHAAALVGPAHCHVLDHGSTDGSTDRLGAINVLRLPRSPMDDTSRAACISDIAAALLHHYDAVLYSDVDELVFPDPAHHATLADLLAATDAPVIHAIGVNVVQVPGEPALNPYAPALAQRGWVHMVGSMCKPHLIRRSAGAFRWAPGFHHLLDADPTPAFPHLMMAHLRWIDADLHAARLTRTRAQPWTDPAAAWWQRLDDAAGAALHEAHGRRPRDPSVDVSATDPAVQAALAAAFAHPDGATNLRANYQHETLWPLPSRWRTVA